MHTLFELCRDIAATRRFYTDGVGLQETFFDEAKGWLTYQAGAVQVVFTTSESVEPLQGWSHSPAWDGGEFDAPSWVFQVAAGEFDNVVSRLQGQGVELQFRGEQGDAMREVYALDPMGKLVEVYCEAAQEPA